MRKSKFSAKHLAVLSVLTAISLVIFVIESLIPPLIPIAPYVKIGLSNSIILFIIVIYGLRDATLVMLCKVLLGSLFCGVYALPYNLAGGVCSLIVMWSFYKLLFPKISIVSISVIGAVISNIARTLVAVAIMNTGYLLIQIPIVSIVSVLAGILIGVLTCLMVKYLPSTLINDNVSASNSNDKTEEKI